MKKTNQKRQNVVKMPLVHPDAAGIDVGDTIHAVAVPEGRDEERVRSFGTMTWDLEEIIKWLRQCLAGGKFRTPHLFLIDCQLPKLSGTQICKYLKSHPVLSVVPVVLMSAQRRFEAMCKALGAVAFVNKPFEMRALIEVVNGHSSALETR